MKDNSRWMELCYQASVEQDPEKLMALVTEINRLLDEKHDRIINGPPSRKAREAAAVSKRESAMRENFSVSR
jgi:hypothetical protein